MRIKGTLQQRQLARTLRRLREDAGLSLEEAAPKLMALHLTRAAEVDACKQVFDGLRSKALNPPDSTALIERLAATL